MTATATLCNSGQDNAPFLPSDPERELQSSKLLIGSGAGHRGDRWEDPASNTIVKETSFRPNDMADAEEETDASHLLASTAPNRPESTLKAKAWDVAVPVLGAAKVSEPAQRLILQHLSMKTLVS